MFLLFFFKLNQFLFEDFLQTFNQLFIIFLNLRYLYLCLLKNLIFNLVTIGPHSNIVPLLQTNLESSSLIVFVTTLFHFSEIFVSWTILFPGLEESIFMVFRVKKGSKIFYFISFFLNLSKKSFTLRLRMQ
jgi:hypothetical protein